METLISPSPAALNDATLVQRALEGEREAYGQIVTRYQSLICAVAYSGTGDLSHSQDVAQETFVTAWKHLCDLRDPSRLRAWLCGIARNLVHNARRRAAREPAEIGGSPDPLRDVATLEASPSDETIRREEEAILWRALARIPENYREPLILFYREHRSVEQVAQALGLSVDATKQRLSRGRVLLHDEVIAFIAGTLEKTKPGPGFTSCVMSALPLVLPTAVGTAGASAAKSSAAAKAGGTITSGATGIFAALVSAFALLGAFTGWQMAATAQSSEERRWAARFWRSLGLVAVTCIAPTFLLLGWAGPMPPWAAVVLTYYLLGGYVAIAVPFGIWTWENHRRIRGADGKTSVTRSPLFVAAAALALAILGVGGAFHFGFPSGHWTDVWLTIVFALTVMASAIWVWERRQRGRLSPFASPTDAAVASGRAGALRWVGAATAGMIALLIVALSDGGRATPISPSVARQIIATHPSAKLRLYDYKQGVRHLALSVEDGGRTASYTTRADTALVAELTQAGVMLPVLHQGRDFETLGIAGRSLFMLAIITAAAGTVLIGCELRRRSSGGIRATASASTP